MASKKLPPLKGGDFWLDLLPRLPRLANAFGLAWTGGEVGFEKLNPPNASFIPPKEDCCGDI